MGDDHPVTNFEASWPSPLPTTPSPLDHVAVPYGWNSSTVQIDPPLLPNAQLVPPIMADAQGTGKTAPTTGLIPSHSSHTSSFGTNDSSTDFAIRLLKPPTQGSVVVLSRIETHVYLDIDLPSGSWKAVRLPLTKSVTSDDSSSLPGYIKPLLLVTIVRGSTTRQECTRVCVQCEKRTGRQIGPPSLIDFHSSSNIITPRGGTIRVHFTFTCYSRHHQKKDQEYVLEVILKDESNPSEPIEVAMKELPYSFDVRSSIPRAKGPTSDYTQQTNIGTSSNIRRRAKRPGPAATPSHPPSAQLAAGPHLGGIESQELMAGQRTSGHVSSIGEQSPSDLQRLPSAISAPHPSAVPKPPLLVQLQHHPSGGEERDSLEGGQGSEFTMRLEGSSLYTSAPRTPFASDPGPQHMSGGSRGLLRQQEPFVHAPIPSFGSSHMLPNAEVQIRGKVADREVQINTLEKYIQSLSVNFEADGRKKGAVLQSLINYLHGRVISIEKEIADHLGALSAERQKDGEAVNANVANLEAQIHILRQENYHDVSGLTAMANTHWIDDRSEADIQQ